MTITKAYTFTCKICKWTCFGYDKPEEELYELVKKIRDHRESHNETMEVFNITVDKVV